MDIISAIASGLGDLGLGVTSNAAYDFFKKRFAGQTQINKSELENALGDFLVVQGVKAKAATVITLLAEKGYLQVTGSTLYAPNELAFGAASAGKFVVGDGTTTKTDKTAIQAGQGAFIAGSGSAVVQNADGSISFHVGENPSDGMSFFTGGKK